MEWYKRMNAEDNAGVKDRSLLRMQLVGAGYNADEITKRSRHRQNGDKILNLPIRTDEAACCKNDHADDADKSKEHAELELLKHFGHFDEEVGELGFLRSRTPRHVDFEHVREKSLRNMEGETTQEDTQHEGPLEVQEY
ncbi:MAG: hypothetical protein Q9196_002973 [Gyalolechia fulgens]